VSVFFCFPREKLANPVGACHRPRPFSGEENPTRKGVGSQRLATSAQTRFHKRRFSPWAVIGIPNYRQSGFLGSPGGIFGSSLFWDFGSRPACSSARCKTHSIWPLRLLNSSSAQPRSASSTSGVILNKKLSRLAILTIFHQIGKGSKPCEITDKSFLH
jgi:hypothetical protein